MRYGREASLRCYVNSPDFPDRSAGNRELILFNQRTKISRAELRALSSAPDALIIRYLSLGLTPFVLVFLVVLLSALISRDRREDVHCDRRAESCVISSSGLIRRPARVISLDRVTSAKTYLEVENGKHGRHVEQGIELMTIVGPVRLELTEPCGGFGCVEVPRAQAKIQEFLRDPTRPRVEVSYGPFLGSLSPFAAFVGIAFAVTLLTWQRVVVTIVPGSERFCVFHWRLLLWIQRFELPLPSIAACVIAAAGLGRHSFMQVELVSQADERFILVLGGDLGKRALRRFVVEVDAALEKARMR